MHPIDLRVEAVSAVEFIYDRNLGAMVMLDWFALLFSSTCVAFKVAGERNDIELCRLAVAHGRDELAPGQRLTLGVIAFVRRWCFLPLVILSMVTMVLYRGSDAMSVCLNAIGVIFLCDIDNIVYTMALSGATKAEIERGLRAGKCGQLTDVESSALDRSKLVHVFLLVLYVLIVVNGLLRINILRLVSASTRQDCCSCDPPSFACQTVRAVGVLRDWSFDRRLPAAGLNCCREMHRCGQGRGLKHSGLCAGPGHRTDQPFHRISSDE